MTEGFKEVVGVSINDEWTTDFPDAALIKLSKGQIARIVKLANAAQEIAAENGTAEVRVYDYSLEYGYLDDDEEFRCPKDDDEELYARTECNQMCVIAFGESKFVKWVAYLKHTNIEIETTEVGIQKLVGGETADCRIEN